MEEKEGFKRLVVWERSRDLAVKIYELSKDTNLRTDFGLKDQICRSAVSVPSNIAEGFDRDSSKEFGRFLKIAKGSSAELRTQLDIAHKIGYITSPQFHYLDSELIEISKMLGALIRHKEQQY